MKTKGNRVAIYVRCSTNHQSTDLQKKDLIEYAKKRDYQLFKIYEDVGISGSKQSRPALDQLFDDARKKRFDIILVWRFDRFARSLSHLISSLDEFRELGIDFISYSENIDTTTPTGRLVFSVIAAIAEFERLIIQERVKAGVQKAKNAGKVFGRPRAGFNYSLAIEMHKQGKSLRKIAKALGVSHSTIKRSISVA